MISEGVIGLVEDPSRKNYFLWVKRMDLPIWVLPGGGIDLGESPEAAVVREVFEETGLQVTVKRKAAEYSPVNKWTATTHVFICERKGGELTRGEESAEVSYFHLDSPPSPFFPLHHAWLKEALLNQGGTIKRPLTEFKWWKVGMFFFRHPVIVIRYLLASWL